MHTPETNLPAPAGWTELLETTQDMIGDSQTNIGYVPASYLVRQLHERTNTELGAYVDFSAGRTLHDLLVHLADDDENLAAEVALNRALNENDLATRALFAPGAIGYMDKQRLGRVGRSVFGDSAIDLFLELPLAERALCEAAITARQLRVKSAIPLVNEYGDPNHLAIDDIMRTDEARRSKLMARVIGGGLLTHGVAALRHGSNFEGLTRSDETYETTLLQLAAAHTLSPDAPAEDKLFTMISPRPKVEPERVPAPVDELGLVKNTLEIIWRAGQPDEAS